MNKVKSDEREGILVRLPAHLKRKAKALASLSGRSLQEIAKQLWEQWIEEESKKQKEETK